MTLILIVRAKFKLKYLMKNYHLFIVLIIITKNISIPEVIIRNKSALTFLIASLIVYQNHARNVYDFVVFMYMTFVVLIYMTL